MTGNYGSASSNSLPIESSKIDTYNLRNIDECNKENFTHLLRSDKLYDLNLHIRNRIFTKDIGLDYNNTLSPDITVTEKNRLITSPEDLPNIGIKYIENNRFLKYEMIDYRKVLTEKLPSSYLPCSVNDAYGKVTYDCNYKEASASIIFDARTPNMYGTDYNNRYAPIDGWLEYSLINFDSPLNDSFASYIQKHIKKGAHYVTIIPERIGEAAKNYSIPRFKDVLDNRGKSNYYDVHIAKYQTLMATKQREPGDIIEFSNNKYGLFEQGRFINAYIYRYNITYNPKIPYLIIPTWSSSPNYQQTINLLNKLKQDFYNTCMKPNISESPLKNIIIS